MKELSVVIPAYNEEANIGRVVSKCSDYLPKAEIIVVNDGSNDSTAAILGKLGIQLPNLRVLDNEVNMGHARTLVKGLKEAQAGHVLYIDADDQIDIADLPEFKGFDLVSGFRVNRQDKTFRKMVSFILKMTILARHGMYIKDANCPFKIFERDSMRSLLDKLPQDYIVPSIDLEILARREGMRVQEVPVIHHPLAHPRGGFLQSVNPKSMTMFRDAFWEVVNL